MDKVESLCVNPSVAYKDTETGTREEAEQLMAMVSIRVSNIDTSVISQGETEATVEVVYSMHIEAGGVSADERVRERAELVYVNDRWLIEDMYQLSLSEGSLDVEKKNVQIAVASLMVDQSPTLMELDADARVTRYADSAQTATSDMPELLIVGETTLAYYLDAERTEVKYWLDADGTVNQIVE